MKLDERAERALSNITSGIGIAALIALCGAAVLTFYGVPL